MDDLTNIDLYDLLDILSSATTKEIKKAYRKKALKCHPDKNPDNPKAAELFHQLSRALEILTDDSARAAYDKVINAKKAAALRTRELDSKRKKLKEELETKERQAQFDITKEKTAEEKLKVEIERLRKEGSKQLEEEIEFVRLQVQREKCNSNSTDKIDPVLVRLKVSWNFANDDAKGDVYNHDSLEKIFSKYGEIAALVVSNKKKGSALVEFTSSAAAMKAKELEKGFSSNPLRVNWLSGAAPTPAPSSQNETDRARSTAPEPNPGSCVFPSVPVATAPSQHRAFPCFPSTPDIFTKNRQEKQDIDFESAVLSRMRRAEEEKRKAAEIETENKDS